MSSVVALVAGIASLNCLTTGTYRRFLSRQKRENGKKKIIICLVDAALYTDTVAAGRDGKDIRRSSHPFFCPQHA